MTRDEEVLLALAKLAACNRELAEKTKELDKSIVQLTELTHGAVRTLNERVAALEARLDAKDTPPRLREKRKARPSLKLRGIPCPWCHGEAKLTPCARCSGTGEIL